MAESSVPARPKNLLAERFDKRMISQVLAPAWNAVKSSIYAQYIMQKKRESAVSAAPLTWSRISTNLANERYSNPWMFCMEFDGVVLEILGFFSGSRVAEEVKDNCFKLRLLFASLVNPIMREEFGFCCGEVQRYMPPTGHCMGASDCRILFGDVFYRVVYPVGRYPQVYSFCSKHFEESDKINVSTDFDVPIYAPKEDFQQLVSVGIRSESFVACRNCGRSWHKACAFYSNELTVDGFACDKCRAALAVPVAPRQSARDLQATNLSDHLEARLRKFYEDLIATGDGVLTSKPDVFVRVVHDARSEAAIPPALQQIYGPTAPSSLPYRTKTIFAFETIAGRDVCFFGFMVQEYGNECAGPNHRCVYVSYLGSLKYPVHGDRVKGLSTKNVGDVDANNNVDTRSTLLRTQTYHQVLLGYLDYTKKLGYNKCYITAVPPMPNENYIFPRHPPSMKFPDESRLLKWYDELLKQAKAEGVVLEYSDLSNHVKRHNNDLSATLPFFDGDVRSDKVVEMISETVSKSEEPAKKRSRHDYPILKTLLEHVDNTGHLTLVLKLRSNEATPGKDLVDPDPLMPSTLLASCDDFIYYANEKCWEFSSLRRAQYTTQMIALTLHRERSRDTAAAVDDSSTVSLVHCDICNFIARFSCSECEQDFCKQCASGHDHPLDAIEFMEPLDENAANQFFGM